MQEAATVARPTLSIVVATRNRSEQLERCLDAMKQMVGDDWELVVVDNGSTDSTPAVLERRQGEFARFVAIHSPVPGLGRARNDGWVAASGDIIAFTDDDCYPSTTFVADVRAEFESDTQLGFLTGRILLHDPDDLPMTINTSPDVQNFAPRTYLATGRVHGANLSFRRIVLEEIDGFDPAFGAGTPFPCEDVDAAARALWAGYAGKYSPVPTVRHHHGRRDIADADRLFEQYSAGRGAYFAKFIASRPTRWRYIRAYVRKSAGQVRDGYTKQLWQEAEAGWAWLRRSD
jgi:glycosyltransferase involved in cell wall biosynthesis